jgi:hypothetical protein
LPPKPCTSTMGGPSEPIAWYRMRQPRHSQKPSTAPELATRVSPRASSAVVSVAAAVTRSTAQRPCTLLLRWAVHGRASVVGSLVRARIDAPPGGCPRRWLVVCVAGRAVKHAAITIAVWTATPRACSNGEPPTSSA